MVGAKVTKSFHGPVLAHAAHRDDRHAGVASARPARSRPQRLSTPALKFSMMMSLSRASLRAMLAASGVRHVQRDVAFVAVPHHVVRVVRRVGAARCGTLSVTLMTSAPRSPRTRVPNGPASTWVKSRTRIPASGARGVSARRSSRGVVRGCQRDLVARVAAAGRGLPSSAVVRNSRPGKSTRCRTPGRRPAYR